MQTEFYWTIVVAVISAGWVVTTFIRDRISQSIAQTSAMTSRLIEYDKLIIEHPDIQKFLSQTATQEEEYFRVEDILTEELYYKAKSLVYKQLNLFDEILSVSSKTGGWLSFLKPATLVEIEDWEAYIKEKLRHPLYRSILNNEMHIFGTSLRDFWVKNRATISSSSVDPFIW